MGTARATAVQSTLRGYLCDIVDGVAHVLVLAECFVVYIEMIRSSITHTTNVEDAVAAHVYTEVARGIDKRLWCLEAYLDQGGQVLNGAGTQHP